MMNDFPATRILSELNRDNLTPAILFRTSRRQCDEDIERLASSKVGKLPIPEQRKIAEEVLAVIAKYNCDPPILLQHPHYHALISNGVGAHHAGQLLVWRLLLEELMTRGLLRLMVATGTVAAGVDFPARTVIITAHSRRGTEGFNTLTSSELMQMAGRAGRRGKDAVGICLVAPNRFLDARVVHDIARRPAEPLRSAYFAAPSTVLNLLKHRNVDDLRYTVSRSLAAFLDRKAGAVMREEAKRERAMRPAGEEGEALKRTEKRERRKVRMAEELETRQIVQLDLALTGLEKLGYMQGGSLSPKGYWAAELYTSLVLELGEAVNDGLLNDLSAYELAGLVGSIAGDPHRTYLSIKANPIKKEYFEAMTDILVRVRTSFQNPNTTETKVVPDAALTVITWMQSESWSEFASLLKLAGAAEGDVARLVTQTADHLNQLSRLHHTFPSMAGTAAEARKLLLRPPLSESVVGD
jgi:ATP-dependent RNA helicase HelY